MCQTQQGWGWGAGGGPKAPSLLSVYKLQLNDLLRLLPQHTRPGKAAPAPRSAPPSPFRHTCFLPLYPASWMFSQVLAMSPNRPLHLGLREGPSTGLTPYRTVPLDREGALTAWEAAERGMLGGVSLTHVHSHLLGHMPLKRDL